MTTYAEFRKAVQGYQFNGNTSEADVLDAVAGAGNWQFSAGYPSALGTTNVILVDGTLHVKFPKTQDKTKKAKDTDAAPAIAGLTGPVDEADVFVFHGNAVVPIAPPYEDLADVMQRNVLYNIFRQLGAKVEYKAVANVAPVVELTNLPKREAQPEPTQASNPNPIFCQSCNNEVTGYTAKSGKYISPKQQADMTQKSYGETLCKTCNGKRYYNKAS